MNKHFNKTNIQGKIKQYNKQYFEGWYFKQVTADKKFTISFIPGVSYNKKIPTVLSNASYLILKKNLLLTTLNMI